MTNKNILSGLCQLEHVSAQLAFGSQSSRLGFQDAKSQATFSLFSHASSEEFVIRGLGTEGTSVVSSFVTLLVLEKCHSRRACLMT